MLATADAKQSKSSPPHNKQEKMSSTTDIEMAYSPDGSYIPDGSDALTSSDPTNGDLLKILLEMKKENTDYRIRLSKEICFNIYVMGVWNGLFLLFILIMVAENNRGLYINGDKNRFRCGN